MNKDQPFAPLGPLSAATLQALAPLGPSGISMYVAVGVAISAVLQSAGRQDPREFFASVMEQVVRQHEGTPIGAYLDGWLTMVQSEPPITPAPSIRAN